MDWIDGCKDGRTDGWIDVLYRLVESKREHYWRAQIEAHARDCAFFWSLVGELLCRKGDYLSGLVPGLVTEALADFVDRMIADIRSATDGAVPAEFRDIRSGDRVPGFKSVSTDDVRRMVSEAADNYSMLESYAYLLCSRLTLICLPLHRRTVLIILVIHTFSCTI